MNVVKRSIRITALLLAAAMLLPAAPQTNQPPGQPNPADMREFYNYVLTMDKIQKLAAVEKDLDTLQKNDPALRQSMEKDASSAADLNQAAQKLQKFPQAVAIMKKYGLTPRDYIVATITFIQSVTAVGFKKNGTYKEYPAQVRQMVSPVNLAFVDQHWAEISKIVPSLQ